MASSADHTKPEAASASAASSGRSLWLWVGGAFLILFGLWATLFLVARSAHIESVPLQTEGTRK